MTLHVKCRHPEAIRSALYTVLDNEASLTEVGHLLYCDVCGVRFDKESTLIVHSWTHLAGLKAANQKAEKLAKVAARAERAARKREIKEIMKRETRQRRSTPDLSS